MRQDTAARDERSTGPATGLTVGLDLADASSSVCVIDEAGEVVEEARRRRGRAPFSRAKRRLASITRRSESSVKEAGLWFSANGATWFPAT